MTKKPRYEEIFIHLTQYFKDNKYLFNQQIPTEHSLMDMFNVSRTTIRRALQLLEDNQIISRTQGCGSFYIADANLEKAQIIPSITAKVQKGFIGLVNYFSLDYIYTEIVRGIEDVLSENGYSLVLGNSNQDESKQIEVVKRMVNQGVKGLILEPSRNLLIDENNLISSILDESGLPVVTTHWAIKDKNVSTVTIDDEYAGYIAGQYLLKKGHRKIATVYKIDVQAGHDRFIGLKRIMTEKGLSIPNHWIKIFTEEDEQQNQNQGYSLTKDLLLKEEGDRPTAIFFMNDRLAVGGYKAIREMGLKIPDDISVIGFDNHESASVVHPGLTTFSHPKYRLGKWAARTVIDMVESESSILPMKIVFEPKMVERGSVRDLSSID